MIRKNRPQRRRKSKQLFFSLELDEGILKGDRSEDVAEEGLEILREAGHIYRYVRTKRWGELDWRGIDSLVWPVLWLQPKRGWILPLQIKSSRAGREEHFFNYGDSVPYCIVVKPGDLPIDVAWKILQELDIPVRPLGDFIKEAFEEILDESVCSFGLVDEEETLVTGSP